MSANKLSPRHGDLKLFDTTTHAALRCACDDLSWLRTRSYADTASLKLVGDHYQLQARQRRAVSAASCSDNALAHRQRTQLTTIDLAGRIVAIDGYNLLITLATAQAGGLLLRGRGGALRDLAGVHGAYKPDTNTPTLLKAIGNMLAEADCDDVAWYLDSPISKSGQLTHIIRTTALDEGWPWSAETVPDPDPILQKLTNTVIVSSDAAILDQAQAWIDIATPLINTIAPNAWFVDVWNQ